ncbi:hypothetical protein [Rhizobium rhizophilum]|uniref:Sialate O-acetylesterase domain-containing protein n=1 Tax=Rhizobium rhizophilum TaxID=1850373 RepID=A0ABY2QT06_9HYPH|nr:hypothetical protein [Rhizobium rhizophilum]THV13723.1 hypothetical protein E9677_12485 [Rhizobium rhizophilum]
MRYWLSAGQSSNVAGDSQGGPFDISSLVRVWNNATNRDDTTLLGDDWEIPDRNANPFFLGGNHKTVQAASVVANITGEGQRVVTCGRNGRSIDYWHNGTTFGEQYTRLKEVLDTVAITRPYDVFDWNQGSADNASAAAYPAKFADLLDLLTADGFIDANTVIIITETSWANSPLINPVLKDIADNDPRAGFAGIGYFPTVDGTHFTGLSQFHAGYETVRAMSETGTWAKNLVNPNARGMPTGTGLSRGAAA